MLFKLSTSKTAPSMKLRGKCSVKCDIYSTLVLYVVPSMNSKGGNLIPTTVRRLVDCKADRRFKALCKSCDQMINISNMRESALKSHMESQRYKNNCRIGGEQAVALSSIGLYHPHVEVEIQTKQEKRAHRNHNNKLS